jgi:nanoRNase/pAp phosphatase (c-di-AMP/oligoRNAs hydrolase)
MDLTPKQQTSEAIRQAETILITTGQHPTVDQIAGVMALAAILRKFGKKVSAIISDPLPAPAAFLGTDGLDKGLTGMRDFVLKVDVSKAEVDKLRYEVEDGKLNIYITPFKGGFAPSDVTFDHGDFHYDLAIVLGVANRNRIDKVYADNPKLFGSIPVINLDFHRINENYGAVNLIEPTASSLCEMLIALSESLQSGLVDADIATIMLAGLMASTDRFTASHTTSKSLTVAAQMMAAGARQQQVVKGLFNRETPGRDRDRSERNDRGDRNERTDRPRGNEARQSDQRPRQQQPEQPRATEAKPQPQFPSRAASTEPKAAPAAMEMEQVPAPVVVPTPLAVEEPIIQPDHIELSQLEQAPAEAMDETPQMVTPMADFAAAAEMLRQRDPEPEDEAK